MQTYNKTEWQQIPRKVLSCVYDVLKDAAEHFDCKVEDLDYKVRLTPHGPQVKVYKNE